MSTALSSIFERFDADAPTPSSIDADDSLDLQRKCAAVYEEGFEAGKAAAQVVCDQQTEALRSVISVLEQQLATLESQANANLCEGMAAVLRQLFPALSAKGFASEAATLLSSSLQVTASKIKVRVAPDLVDLLGAAMEEQSDFDRITIEPDGALGPSEVSAEWQNGGLEFNGDHAIQQCLESLEKTAATLKGDRSHEQ